MSLAVETSDSELKVGDFIQVDDNEDKDVNSRNGTVYMIFGIDDYDIKTTDLVRWKGNDCNNDNYNNRPSLNSWSSDTTRATLSKINPNTIIIERQSFNFKKVESPDPGKWKKKVFWKKDNNMRILTIDGVEYKVGDCCKIDLGNKMKAINDKLTVPDYDAIICEFTKNSDYGHDVPATESDNNHEDPTVLDYVIFYLFKPNVSEKFNFDKLINRKPLIKPFIKIKLSLMEIVNHGFIKSKNECLDYDPTQIKLITGGKRSRKTKKQKKTRKSKSRSRK